VEARPWGDNGCHKSLRSGCTLPPGHAWPPTPVSVLPQSLSNIFHSVEFRREPSKSRVDFLNVGCFLPHDGNTHSEKGGAEVGRGEREEEGAGGNREQEGGRGWLLPIHQALAKCQALH
jgi:hypothetical protein